MSAPKAEEGDGDAKRAQPPLLLFQAKTDKRGQG